jgi:mercuric reductase
MVVIGSGPTGLEFAQMFSRFGARVTVLEKENQLLPATEPVVAEELRRLFEAEGIEVHTGVVIDEIYKEKGLKVVAARAGKRDISARGEELLLAAGVLPL